MCAMKDCNLNFAVSVGREPWSSGYGRRLTIKRSMVQIPSSDVHFSRYIVAKIVKVCLQRPKINEKEAVDGPYF